MYRIVICDNQPDFIQYMKRMILLCDSAKEELEIFTFTSGEEFLLTLEELPSCELLILEPKIGGKKGEVLAKRFRLRYPGAVLVYYSAVRYATDEIFKTAPYRYLQKGCSEKKMYTEMKAVLQKMREQHPLPLILGKHYCSVMALQLHEVLYIENGKSGSILHLTGPRAEKFSEHGVRTDKKLRELYDSLKDYGFEYAHNSYLVNLKFVTQMISNRVIKLADGSELNVSRSKLMGFREALLRFMEKNYI